MVATIASKFSEVYEVERTIEVVATLGGQNERIRIDALRDYSTGTYSTRAYIAYDAALLNSYAAKAGKTATDDHEIWVLYDLPWTNRTNANDALVQALSFLDERQA